MTRQQCRSITNGLIETGKIPRGTVCEKCGTDKKIHCHHNDYTDPENISWLCRPCHVTLHGKLKRKGDGIPMDKPDIGIPLSIKGVDAALVKRLKYIALDEDSNLRELVIEGIRLVIARHDKGK